MHNNISMSNNNRGYYRSNVNINHKKISDKLDTKTSGRLNDTGNRRVFDTGAVRDISEGKGRCDLMPLDVVADLLFPSDKFMLNTLKSMQTFMSTLDYEHLDNVVEDFLKERNWSPFDALLEVAKHYEAGARKYGEHNWEKGIPAHSYIDSAVRHLTKWRMGLADEPHDRAFLWNIIGLAWTCKNHSNLIDFRPKPNEALDTDTDIATSIAYHPDPSVSTVTTAKNSEV